MQQIKTNWEGKTRGNVQKLPKVRKVQKVEIRLHRCDFCPLPGKSAFPYLGKERRVLEEA